MNAFEGLCLIIFSIGLGILVIEWIINRKGGDHDR